MKSKNYTSTGERMYTKRLTIERFSENDRDFFLKITGDPDVKKYFSSWKEIEECEEYFEKEIIQIQDAGNLFLVIRQKDSTPIGILNAFYTANGGWIFEYALLEAFRKHGYMTELLEYICQNDFEFLSTFRTNKNTISYIEFEVRPDNINSEKVLRTVAKNLKLPIEYNNGWTYIDIM